MAAQLKASTGSPRRRVFVLVDKGEVKGVFPSWDAAEAFADDNRYSLDHLYEFQTKPDHPDHLHLMAAQWDGVWKFVGEWSKKTPDWEQTPARVRLDHYHALGQKFHLLRQKDFKWRDGVLDLINPMAPDAAIQIDAQVKSVPPPPKKPEWKPKLAPLRPVQKQQAEPAEENAPKEVQPEPSENQSKSPVLGPLMEENGPPEAPSKDFEKEPPPPAEAQQAPAAESSGATPKISFPKKTALRLKTDRPGPKPIPHFQTVPDPPPEPPTTKRGLPQPGEAIPEPVEEAPGPEKAPAGKVRKVWPMRLILPVVSIFLFWAAGLWWALKPPATTQSIIEDLSSLSDARIVAIEPGQIFFQLEVDPIHQQRWVRSLGLLPIPFGKTLNLPTYHALDTWEQPDGFIRPPYAEVEVREWWDLRLRRISYGFYHEWEDGTLLVLDLQGDLLIGWGQARNLPDLMN